MVDYVRYVIYLNEYFDGKKQRVSPGFARLERRDGVWSLALNPGECQMKGKAPLYLMGKRGEDIQSFCFGDFSLCTSSYIRLSEEAVRFINEQDVIEGIVGGTPEHYVSGNCDGTSREIAFTTAEVKRPDSGNQRAADREEKLHNSENQEDRQREQVRRLHFQEMYPFEDDEFERCFQIEPRDLGNLSPEQWHLTGSSFLLQGYYNYRHLIYAKEGGRSYIGVPGQFHRREQYLASRFGFPRFKGTQKKRVTPGDFGYWLREIGQ